MRDDRGSIVIGWLVKLAVVLTLFAVVGFEFVSIGLAKLSVQDTADSAAREASHHYRQNRSVQRAYEEALKIAAEKDVTIKPEEFTITRDGTVTLTAHKTANSTFLSRFDQTKDMVEVKAEATARFVP